MLSRVGDTGWVQKEILVADVVFVLVTLGGFGLLALCAKAAEKL